ncbi:MAG: proline--tRNA ligase [Bryobacteraceae bacterium]
MHWSQLFIPTLRETPAVTQRPVAAPNRSRTLAEPQPRPSPFCASSLNTEVVSHRLLLRAGYIRQLSAGIYNYLYLAQRSLQKIQRIIREEMDAIGAQEILLPALQPAELWKESGRWDAMGDNLFRLRDRNGRDLCLGMTHEENITALARGELRSYKQLPQIWYQIQTKFRDEPRPKSGLLRVRQFLMKDSYSFDIDAKGLDLSYGKHHAAYKRIFTRCGLEFLIVEAHSGAMGGSQSQEFMVASNAGEDLVVVCKNTGYAANLEKAVSRPTLPPIADPDSDLPPELLHTPGMKTIADIAQFTGLPETSQMKSLVLVGDGNPYLAMLRGDHQMSETKFQAATGAAEIRPADLAEIQGWFGAAAGSLGPVGVSNMPILADTAIQGRRNMIAGANKDDYHLKNVTPGEDFTPQWHDLRQVAQGDTSIDTGDPLEIVKTVEIGHIFKLGYKYSDAFGLKVLDETGKETPVIMGSYGIGVERVLCAAIELYNDANGFSLPPAIAPFTVVITPVNAADPAMRQAAETLYEECKQAGLDPLFDDRDERPGVKFKDADLIGIPYRITIGKKLPQGIVEVSIRRTRESRELPLAEAVSFLVQGVIR